MRGSSDDFTQWDLMPHHDKEEATWNLKSTLSTGHALAEILARMVSPYGLLSLRMLFSRVRTVTSESVDYILLIVIKSPWGQSSYGSKEVVWTWKVLWSEWVDCRVHLQAHRKAKNPKASFKPLASTRLVSQGRPWLWVAWVDSSLTRCTDFLLSK